jgi:CheY-like chemotaxis protein
VVLLVADEAADAVAYRRVFEGAGYRVHCEASGRAARDWLLGKEVPAVTVLIGSMRRMSGWELLEVARSYHRFSAMPGIIVSDDRVALGGGGSFTQLDKTTARAAVLELVARMTRPQLAH